MSERKPGDVAVLKSAETRRFEANQELVSRAWSRLLQECSGLEPVDLFAHLGPLVAGSVEDLFKGELATNIARTAWQQAWATTFARELKVAKAVIAAMKDPNVH